MLPFLLAGSAVQAGDTVTLMLLHDAVLMTVERAGQKLVPVGPPNRYEEIAKRPAVRLPSLCGGARLESNIPG